MPTSLEAFDPFATKAKSLDDFDPFAQPAPVTQATPAPPAIAQPSGLVRRVVGDSAVDLGKGIIGVGEAAVGLADIVSGGYAGKGLEAIGYDPAKTKEMIGAGYSPERVEANKQVADAKGFVPTVKAMIANPSTIAGTAIESAPLMFGGAGLARGGASLLGKAGSIARPGLGGQLAAIPQTMGGRIGLAAAGEGAVGAGMAAEQIRQQSDDGLLSAKQTGAALASGAGTAVLGALGGKVAQKLGIADVDVALAGGATKAVKEAPKSFAGRMKRIAKQFGQGVIAEGALEELPQSIQEQMWQNYATNRPIMEGVPESAAQGLLAGAAMGGPVAALGSNRTAEPAPKRDGETLSGAIDVASLRALPAPDRTPEFGVIRVGPDGTAATKGQAVQAGHPGFANVQGEVQSTEAARTENGTSPAAELAANMRQQAAVMAANANGILSKVAATSVAQEADAIEVNGIPQSTEPPPVPAPWVEPETGELRNPADVEVKRYIHDSINQMADKGVNKKAIEQNLWNLGVTTERTGDLWKQVTQERKQGLTTTPEATDERPAQQQSELGAVGRSGNDVSVPDNQQAAVAGSAGQADGQPSEVGQRATAVEGQPAGAQAQGVTSRPLYEMSQAEIEAQGARARNAGVEIENRILGERADEYRKAVRAANSSNPQRADDGYARQSAIEATLTPAQLDEIAGVNAAPDTFDEAGDYRDALQSADVATPAEAGDRLGYFLSQIGRTEGQDPSAWKRDEQVAYSAIRMLRDRITEKGWDSAAIQRVAIQRAASRFTDPNDAVFMLERFMPKDDVPAQSEPQQKALPTPSAALGDGQASQAAAQTLQPANQSTSANSPQASEQQRGEPVNQALASQEAAQSPNTNLRQSGTASPNDTPVGGVVKDAAAVAATSPTNDTPMPTEAQKEAGNFKVGRLKVNGLDISVEYPAGVKRKDTHTKKLAQAYGYVRRTEGADGEKFDVFLGDRADDTSLPVFVVDQKKRDGSFDEHKAMLGYADEAAARAAYLANYPKEWAKTGFGGIKQMSQDEFKAFVSDTKATQKPVAAKPKQKPQMTSKELRAAEAVRAEKKKKQPPAMFTSGKNVQAVRMPNGRYKIRRKLAKQWQPWQDAKPNFEPTPGLFREHMPQLGTVTINGKKIKLGERQEPLPKPKKRIPHLLDAIAHSGLNREAFRAQGVDPAAMTLRSGIKPVFRKEGGMTLDQLREMMQQDGYLPRDPEVGPPVTDDNDALDVLMRALGGEEIYSEDQGDAVAQQRMDDRAAQEQWEAEVADLAPSIDENDYDAAEALLDAMARANRLGVLTDEIPGESHAAYAARLEQAANEATPNDTDNEASESLGGFSTERQIGAESAQPEAGVEGFALAADTKPAAKEVAPTQGAGLFGAPSTRDIVDNAQRNKDAQRDGKTGTGRTDMLAGDGNLFAGRAPEQTNIESQDAPGLESVESTDQTDTPEFKRWFGGSKVVDADGKPLVVYHGAPDARFMDADATFMSLKDRYGAKEGVGAFWFAKDRATAASYADDRRAFDYQNAEPAVIPAYLKLENPLIVDGGGKNWREAQAIGKTTDVIEKAQADGHDGVIIRNVRDNYNNGPRTAPTDTYVAFDPNQIKSAIANNGNFDPENPSILEDTSQYGERQDTAPNVDSSAELRVIAREFSQADGMADSDNLGLRKAVNAALGGYPPVNVTYLRGEEGLDGIAKPGYVKRLQDQRKVRDSKARTAGLYLRANETVDGKPRVVLFTDVANTPIKAMFTAAHEIAGHHGIRSLLGKKLDTTLARAYQNPTVKAVADAIYTGRGIDKNVANGRYTAKAGRLLAIEEALADLAAANRMGRYEEIQSRHGITVPLTQRKGMKATIARIVEAIKSVFRTKNVRFPDAQVHSLLEASWKAAQDRSASFTSLNADGTLEQVVFHGTPHTVDKFSLNKIGSGEGAQAFGWGLYFASAREVADAYTGNLGIGGSPVPAFYEINGKRTEAGTPEQKAADLIFSSSAADARRLAKSMLADAKAGDEWTQAKGLNYYQRVFDLVSTLKKSDVKKTAGSLYRVSVPDDGDLLDWDKPLKEQPENVQAILRPEMEGRGGKWENASGQEIYRKLAAEGFGDFAARYRSASETLNAMGIPGLRYLDGTSRTKGEGSANYVIWDENAISEPRSAMESVEDQTDTPAFKKWFGDSKVVNADGSPMRVYHGTGDNFEVFERGSPNKKDGGWLGEGFYFSDSPDVASRYAVDKPGEAPNVMPVYLSLQNPAIKEGLGAKERLMLADNRGDKRKLREETARLRAKGHDGIIWKPGYTSAPTEFVVFDANQVKSATGNNGNFDPASDSILESVDSVADAFTAADSRLGGRRVLDAADPYAVENRRLREQDKTLWEKAKTLIRRELTPAGLLPQSVFAEKIQRDVKFRVVEFDVENLNAHIEKAIKEDYGVRAEKLPEGKLAMLGEALAGKVNPNIPAKTRTAILAMRQYIDTMSNEYLGILQARIDVLADKARATDRDTDKAAALREVEMYERIKGNIGAYVHRSYRAFDDAKWFQKVPTETVNAARDYLAAGYREDGASHAEARRLSDVAINEILKNGTAYDSMESFLTEGKLGAKDLSVLMRRKEIAPEIRNLLGEHTDPRMNFTKSATKMGRLIWNDRFLGRVREMGMGAFLHEGKNRPADATTQIAADGSSAMAPLNGLWTTPEVAKAFEDALGVDKMGDIYRTVVRLNGLVKVGKTVLSPTTAMRNWQSAMFFTLANGHFDLTQMKKSIAAFRHQVLHNAKGDELAYIRHMQELGVVYDTPYAGEMRRYIEDSKLEDLLEGKTGDVAHAMRRISKTAQGFYAFGDDFWKIIGFENEKASLIKAGFENEAAEKMAAERIRNTYPTYSMIGKSVKWLSRFPLAGTFVSFPAEIVRTTANMFQLVASDLKSDNPKLRELGIRRAVGMAMVSAGFYAMAALAKSALGVDDDEEEAVRDLAAPWQKNSTLLFTGRDADGKLRYFDLSFLDPYGYWKRPLTAMMRDQPWEESASSAIKDLLEPFFGTDIATGAIFEVMANKKESGGRVYSPNGDAVDQTTAIANHMRKALQPGFMGNAERLYLAGTGTRREGSGQPYEMRDEAAALLGWRASTMDTKTALYYRSFEFTDAIVDARKELTRTLRSANKVSPSDIATSREKAERQYGQAFTQMQRLVTSARSAGMSNSEIVQTLRLSGVSKENAAYLVRGQTPPFRIGTQAAKSAYRNARIMRGEEYAREVASRFREANTLRDRLNEDDE